MGEGIRDLAVWLEEHGLGQYRAVFAEQQLDAETVAELTEADLERLGLPMGPRKKLAKALRALAASSSSVADPVAPTAPSATVERRQLTVLFCDMVGSTTLASSLDPEEMRDVVGAFFDTCTAVVQRFEGFLARYHGDGILAYFGYPRGHEDAGERAVLTGQALVEEVRKIKARAPVMLDARVGIATGVVVVADMGNGAMGREDAVVGAPQWLAARLQALAPPGQVVISDQTRRLLGELFELDDLGEQELKGIASRARAWRVIRPRPVDTRFDALGRSHPGPMVDRQEQLDFLRARWALAQAGHGQAVLLDGAAGIGKSRLCAAMLQLIEDEQHRVIRFQCSSLHTNSALYPIILRLARIAGFDSDDPAEVKLRRVQDLLDEAGVATSASVLAPFLSLEPAPVIPAPILKRRALGLLADWLLASARDEPVLCILEDAHWLDPTTRELLGLIIDRLDHAKLLLMITGRPEARPSFAGHKRVAVLPLDRVTALQSAQIASNMAGIPLPREVLDHIAAKADGVPLFAEELTKAVLELDVLREERGRFVLTDSLAKLSVPSTLQDSLLARLDRLASVKEVAQVAAVIGRDMSHELLAAVAPVQGTALNAALARLSQSGILQRRGRPPETRYAFSHALVQDAAYSTLPHGKRRELHAAVAAALERLRDLAEREPELLAHHLTEAGLTPAAIEWWQKAAERALARAADTEATNYFHRALEILVKLPESTERDERELRLRKRLTPPLLSTKGHDAAEADLNHRRICILCERLDKPGVMLPVLVGQCIAPLVRCEFSLALAQAQACLDIAERAHDSNGMVGAHHQLEHVHLLRGDIGAAQRHLQSGLALCDPALREACVADYAFDLRLTLLSHQCLILQQLGDSSRAEAIAAGVLEEATRLDHFGTSAFVMFHVAMARLIAHDLPALEQVATALEALANRHESRDWQLHCDVLLGWAAIERGQTSEGFTRITRAAAKALEGRLWVPQYRAQLAQTLIERGFIVEAFGRLDAAQAIVEASGQRFSEPELHRLRALARQRQGAAPEEIIALFERALETARRNGSKLWELRAAMDLAEFLGGCGRRQEAGELLAPVCASFAPDLSGAELSRGRALLAAQR